MSRSRPINRRPWRRPPWRANRRPALWRDANTVSTLSATPGSPWAPLAPPTGVAANHTLRELLAGDIDTQYLDKQEVRVDRIVGDLQFWTASVADEVLVLPPVVRWGLVVEEDPTEVGTINTLAYSLWRAEELRDTEWMHLSQPAWTPGNLAVPAENFEFRTFYASEHVDIRVKRKLGKADRLWLVMSYGNGAESGTPANVWGSDVWASHLLRAIVVS